MSLTMRQLEIVRAVSRYGSVTLAAETLAISQPAVSMVLRDAAKAAGFPLFARRQGRLQPRAETKGLLAELERVFDGVDRIKHLIEDMRDTQIGTVRVAATPTLADNLLPPAVLAFHRLRPRIQVTIHTVDNLNVINAVVEERVDFGVALSPLSLPDARSIPLCSGELVCAVHPDHPLTRQEEVTPQDLAPYPLISFSRNLPLGALVERIFREANVPRRVSFEVNQSSVACALARTGVGVAIIDPFWLIEQSRGVVGVRLRPNASVNAEAMIPKEAPLSRPARMFLATLRRTAADFALRV